MKPFGDGFIRLIKMMIAPIIFTTVVVGIAKIGDMKKVGRVGLKALVYFELVSTLALVIGLVVVNVVRPGVGINADVRHARLERGRPPTPRAENRCRPWTICSTSFPTLPWGRSPAARSSRC